MKIKNIFIDLDGTLLNDNNEVIEDLKKVIRNNSSIIGLATNRSYDFCKPIIDDLNLTGLNILEDGAIIKENGENIAYTSPKNVWVARTEIFEYLDRMGVNYNQTRKEYLLSIHIRDENYKKNSKLMKKLNEPIMKILNKHDLEGYDTGMFNFVIKEKHISKGNSLELLEDIWKIRLDQTLTIGDGINDILMLSNSKYSATVNNGIKQVKNIVDFVSKYDRGEGVLDILTNYAMLK